MSKIKNMSLAIEPNLQEHLKKEATKRGVSTSKLIRDLVLKFLPETTQEGTLEFNTVILRIPKNLNTKELLEEWLKTRCTNIVKSLMQSQ